MPEKDRVVVAELHLEVRYLGPQVALGRMSAVDLGPAIFGIGAMVSGAAKELYGDETRVQVEVRADFEHGSFGIDFFAVSMGGEILLGLTLEELAALATILGLVGVEGIRGVIAIARKLAGRKLDRIEQIGDRYEIHVHDESINVSIDEYKVITNPKVREGLEAVVQPLEKPGIQAVRIKVEDHEPVGIDRSERESFKLPSPPDEEIGTHISTRVIEVLSPAFREANKWRFAEGDSDYYATVEDDDFLQLVDRHDEVFGKGDALVVEMETTTRRKEGRYEYDRRITRVIDHFRPSEGAQIPLLDLPPINPLEDDT